jgi:hypothetical protein
VIFSRTPTVSCSDIADTWCEKKEADMAIATLVDSPAGSQEIYAKIREHLRLERPTAGILRLAGPGPNGGWRVIEVFESEEEATQFLKERAVLAKAVCRITVAAMTYSSRHHVRTSHRPSLPI